MKFVILRNKKLCDGLLGFMWWSVPLSLFLSFGATFDITITICLCSKSTNIWFMKLLKYCLIAQHIRLKSQNMMTTHLRVSRGNDNHDELHSNANNSRTTNNLLRTVSNMESTLNLKKWGQNICFENFRVVFLLS